MLRRVRVGSMSGSGGGAHQEKRGALLGLGVGGWDLGVRGWRWAVAYHRVGEGADDGHRRAHRAEGGHRGAEDQLGRGRGRLRARVRVGVRVRVRVRVRG